MLRRDLYLVIDQGGHASRALVFDDKGRVVGEGYEEIGTLRAGDDRVEHDPEEIVRSITGAIERAVRSGRGLLHNIAVAGLATQRSSIVCWDRRNGKALSPIISWQDRRAAHWMRRYRKQAAKIHSLTGLFPSAHYGVSKLKWCLEHLAGVKEALENGCLAWGPMSSFLCHRLVTEHPLLADPANASRTLLWNMRTLNWDDYLLRLFDLPREPLPHCVATRYDFGSLDVLGVSIPLRIVNGDQSAALFAFGKPDPAAVYVNVGTGAFVQRTRQNTGASIPRLLTSVVLQDGGNVTYVLEGTVNGAGCALVQVARQLGLDPREVQEELPRWMDVTDALPLFLNGVSGLGAPFWVENFNSRFIGEGEGWERLVAVAESIVFLLQTNLEEMHKHCSVPERVVISGGLAIIDPLCQRLADLSAIPVYRPQQCEATARGTAHLLAGNSVDWRDSGSGMWFQPRNRSDLDDRYRLWQGYMAEAVLEG